MAANSRLESLALYCSATNGPAFGPFSRRYGGHGDENYPFPVNAFCCKSRSNHGKVPCSTCELGILDTLSLVIVPIPEVGILTIHFLNNCPSNPWSLLIVFWNFHTSSSSHHYGRSLSIDRLVSLYDPARVLCDGNGYECPTQRFARSVTQLGSEFVSLPFVTP